MERKVPFIQTGNYVVSRAAELADFIMRVKEGRYVVIFAPRQTGKTTFFQRALEVFTAEESAYFPIPLNFEVYEDCTPSVFYSSLHEDICEEIENVFARRGEAFSEALAEFLGTQRSPIISQWEDSLDASPDFLVTNA